MLISSYLWWMAGEQPGKVRTWHRSSQRRFAAFGMAIHIPVFLWWVTGGLLASTVFGLPIEASVCVGLGCAALIFIVERLILAVPPSWWVGVFRLVMGVVIALIGASAVDLVLFQKEIEQEVPARKVAGITQEYGKKKEVQTRAVEAAKDAWNRAVKEANDEATGHGGTGRRGSGPVLAQLNQVAAMRRQDCERAEAELRQLDVRMREEIDQARLEGPRSAGLLERLTALHAHLRGSWLGFGAWAVFFSFMLMLELMVVVTKSAFPKETPEEEVERCKEEIIRHKAESFRALVTSRGYRAERLILSAA